MRGGRAAAAALAPLDALSFVSPRPDEENGPNPVESSDQTWAARPRGQEDVDMHDVQVGQTRSFALIGHSGDGKTSLGDSLLHVAGATA